MTAEDQLAAARRERDEARQERDAARAEIAALQARLDALEADEASDERADVARRAIEAETEKARVRHDLFQASARREVEEHQARMAGGATPDVAGPADPSGTAPARRRRGLRRKPERGPFVCAVTGTKAQTEDAEELRGAGWIIRGDTALSPAAQADGWRLPEGAAVPFRGAGTRG